MKIRGKYINQLVSLLASFGCNSECDCLKTEEYPCSGCKSTIDAADKFTNKLHKMGIIGDDLRVIKPKKAVMR